MWKPKQAKTLEFKLSERRSKQVATKFFAKMLEVNGLPRKIVIGKSSTNTAGIKAINRMLKGFDCPIPIEMVRRKYLNNIVEQDHLFIKRRTRPMLGAKVFASAEASLDEIEIVHMITPSPYVQFVELH
ncbi:DDE-type integrase/transposase/recombinase [Ruegeria atlantica]|uniref:DDE-type integrase/transposase/recombinase n=1 Tax=Ruegeria atlantica TaxID=81569 RepID=UPI00266ECBFE|nr:DDE-type integrase/transposase/recombinase [Ruegeria atlantica]